MCSTDSDKSLEMKVQRETESHLAPFVLAVLMIANNMFMWASYLLRHRDCLT